MREFILDSVTKRQRSVPRHLSIWDTLDENEDTAPAPSSRHRTHIRSSTLTSSSCGLGDSLDTYGSQKTSSSQSGSRRRRSRPLPQESRASCSGRQALSSSGEVYTQADLLTGRKKNIAENAAL